MRKRKLPVIMALALMCCLVMLTGKSVEASEGEKIDGSYLTEGDSSAGKAVLKMRGVYLMDRRLLNQQSRTRKDLCVCIYYSEHDRRLCGS